MKLTPNEKRTFLLHLIFSFSEGTTRGVLALNAFVLLRSLKGTNDDVGILFTITWGIMVMTVFFNILMKNSKNIKKLLNIMAIVTRGPLLLFAFFPMFIHPGYIDRAFPIVFLIIFLFYFFSQPFFMPVINLALKTNYSKDKFGRLFSYSNMVRNTMTLTATFIFGFMLDMDYNAYSVVYPTIGVLGIFSIFMLTRIDFDTYSPEIQGTFLTKLKGHLQRMWRILIHNKPYRDFEIGFVFYGIAFMVTDSVIKIFMEDYLVLPYTTISLYENMRWVVAIGLTPVFAMIVDKVDPRKLGIFTFLGLALYIFFIGFTQQFDSTIKIVGYTFHYSILIAVVFFGIFTSMMGILWSIGSSYFCKDKDAGDYQAIHMSLTGVRALLFPIIGIEILKYFDYSTNFWTGVASLLIGMLVLYFSMRKHKNQVRS